MNNHTSTIRTAHATRRGSRDHNMDFARVFHADNGLVGAAVVDGIGNHVDGVEVMYLMAATAARVGTTRGTLAGVLTAATLIEDPGIQPYRPNAVCVLAVAEPGEPTQLAWVGDSHAYGWDGLRLRRRTDPHTMGAFLRQNGEPEEVAELHDNWVRTSLRDATATTVARSEIPTGELVLLVSDGLDCLTEREITDLVTVHQDDPQALAEALVAAAREDSEGYRDDATVVVLDPTST